MAEAGRLTVHQLTLLSQHLDGYIKLYTGQIKCSTKARERFVKVAFGHELPITEHEFAFVAYLEDTETASKQLQEFKRRQNHKPPKRGKHKPPPRSQVTKQANSNAKHKKTRSRKVKSSSLPKSVAEAKKIENAKANRRKAAIERAHEISGFDHITARFVSGGAVRPR